MYGWKVTGNLQVVRTECPECTEDDYGHLYVYLTSGSPNGYCFKCGTFFSHRRLKEFFDDLPESSENLSSLQSIEQAANILRRRVEENAPPEIELPKSVSAWGDKRSRSYLKSRGVSLHSVLLHNIRYCRDGEYKDRVLVPVYYRGKPRTFSARDITGRKFKKYLFPSGVSSSSLLFNLGNVRGKMVVVVEGVFDAIHLQQFHIPTVASFGKKLTLAQQELLKGFERVILCWDADAKEEICKYMRTLPQTEAVFLPKGDPTAYSEREIIRLLRHRLGRVEAAAEELAWA